MSHKFANTSLQAFNGIAGLPFSKTLRPCNLRMRLSCTVIYRYCTSHALAKACEQQSSNSSTPWRSVRRACANSARI